MEDTLRERLQLVSGIKNKVLILVLMEDTLRGMDDFKYDNFVIVLILVLMEDTLRVVICFILV